MNAAHVHLMSNHVPVLGIAFAVFLLAWAVWRGSEEVTRAALGLLFLAGAASLVAFFSGEGAEEIVEGLAGVSHDAIEAHEEAAELGMFVAVGLGIAALAVLALTWKRTVAGWVPKAFLLASLVAFGLLTWAALLGGRVHHEEVRPEGMAGIFEPALGATPDVS